MVSLICSNFNIPCLRRPPGVFVKKEWLNLLIKEKNFHLRTLKGYTPEIIGNIGIAVRKNDATLLNALNEKINEMKADGTLYAILRENGLDKTNMA